jgi:hypothetical protein
MPVSPVGGGGTQDVNITQIQGVAPSATNPLPGRLSNGIGFIDPRDRNWTLSAPGDSVTVSGTVTANQGGAPWTMRLQDAIGATLAIVTAAGALHTNLRDASGNEVASATANASGSERGLVTRSVETVVSSVNSTTTPLGIGGTFTGPFSEDVTAFTAITIATASDVSWSSLFFRFSNDGTYFTTSYPPTVTNSTGSWRIPVAGRYFSVQYVNGGTAQTRFNLRTVYHRGPVSGGTYSIVASLGVNYELAPFVNSSTRVLNASGFLTVPEMRAATPAAGTNGIITRPFMPTDGTNTMPTMNAAARQGFVQLTDGIDSAQVTATAGGSLQVECTAGCGAPSAFTDNSAFTAGTTSIGNIGGVFNDGLANVTSGNAAAPRITTQRGLHANLRDASGNEIASSTSAPVGTERGLMVRNIRTGTESVSLGTSSGKTVTMKTGSLVTTAATADQVILTYTVTAGKTFYLEYLQVDTRLTTFATTATYFGMASLENPSGTKLITQMQAGAGIVAKPPISFTEPLPIAAGTVIRVVCTPSSTTSYTWQANFGGYEK